MSWLGIVVIIWLCLDALFLCACVIASALEDKKAKNKRAENGENDE